MGWRVRYIGTETEPTLATPAKASIPSEMLFETGVVYDLIPRIALALMGDYPDLFERVFGDDPDYPTPAPPPVVLPEQAPAQAEPVEMVTLRALSDTQIPVVPGFTDRFLSAGQEILVHPDIASDMMLQMPGVFETVTPT